MNKAQLIDKLSTQLGSKKAATDAVDAVIDTITRAVASGERVAITGFGVFEKVARPARVGRNPRTGAAVKIKKTTVPKFKAGPGLQGRRQRRQEAAEGRGRRREVGNRHLHAGQEDDREEDDGEEDHRQEGTGQEGGRRRRPRPRRLRPRRPPAQQDHGQEDDRAQALVRPVRRDGPGHPRGFPGPSASASSVAGSAMVRNVTRGPSTSMRTRWPTRSSRIPRRRTPAGRRGARCRRRAARSRTGCPASKLRTVACTRRTYPARGRRVLAASSARVVHGPTPSRTAARRSAAVSTSRRNDGRASAVDLVAARAGVPGRRPGTEHRPQVLGRPGQQQRRPGALRVPDEAAAVPGGAAQCHRELGRPQRRQVGGDGPDRGRRDGAGRRAPRRGPAPALRPASGSSAVTSAPAAEQRRGRLRVVGHDLHGRDQGAGERGRRGVQREGERERLPVAVVRRPEPGLRHGQPLDRQHQAPPSARVVHAPDPASRARHRDRRTGGCGPRRSRPGPSEVAGRRGTG